MDVKPAKWRSFCYYFLILAFSLFCAWDCERDKMIEPNMELFNCWDFEFIEQPVKIDKIVLIRTGL